VGAPRTGERETAAERKEQEGREEEEGGVKR
jgi:hypothetical protein